MLSAQRALWNLRSTLPDPTVLNLAFGFLLDGPFDRRSMERALRDLVDRHEPLRTAYAGPGQGPTAEVLPHSPFALEYEDLSGVRSGPYAAGLLEHFKQALHYRIESPPLVRARCLLLEPDRHLLLMVFDHLAVDGWALELVGREIEQLYSARLAGSSPPLRPLGVGQIEPVEREAGVWAQGPRARAESEQRRREYRGSARARYSLSDTRRRPLPSCGGVLSPFRGTS